MWLYDGRPQIVSLFNVQPKIALLGGVIGAFITYTVVRAMTDLGTAKAEVTIVISQIAVAYFIELFGLFGSEKASFSWIKLLGLVLAVSGVTVFHMCGK
jgi:transporter family-2 protein